jgi:hypothetical protein
MAIVMIQKPPPEMTAESYDAVSQRMDVEHDPPEGMICHSAGQMADGTWRMVDVWESKDAADRFRSERLAPAVMAVASELGMAPGEPDVEYFETYDLQVPAPVHAHA